MTTPFEHLGRLQIPVNDPGRMRLGQCIGHLDRVSQGFLVKARYPEKFSIGLINASGSLGLLLPPSLPVILYGTHAHADISKLFVG